MRTRRGCSRSGTAVESVYLVGFVFIVLSFPTGRLRRASRPGRDLGGGRSWSAWSRSSRLVFTDSQAVLCSGCPRNMFGVSRSDALANGILEGQRITGVAAGVVHGRLAGAAFGGRAKRGRSGGAWRRCSGRGARRSRCWRSRSRTTRSASSLGQAAESVVYCVFAVGADRRVGGCCCSAGWRAARSPGLVVELGERSSGDPICAMRSRVRLAIQTLAPRLLVRRRVFATSMPTGARVELPAPDGDAGRDRGRARRPSRWPRWCTITALVENLELVESVCAAAGADAERTNGCRRSWAGSRSCGRRGRGWWRRDAERRRIERDLHDGAQQRLVSLAHVSGAGGGEAAAGPAAGGADRAGGRGERTLGLRWPSCGSCQGIHPAILSERAWTPRSTSLGRALAGSRARSIRSSAGVCHRPSRRPHTSSSARRSPTRRSTLHATGVAFAAERRTTIRGRGGDDGPVGPRHAGPAARAGRPRGGARGRLPSPARPGGGTASGRRSRARSRWPTTPCSWRGWRVFSPRRASRSSAPAATRTSSGAVESTARRRDRGHPDAAHPHRRGYAGRRGDPGRRAQTGVLVLSQHLPCELRRSSCSRQPAASAIC